ncbi:MAG: AAA family ATPase [Bryobacteraceae bacterium]
MAQTLTADAALIDRATADLNRVREEIGKVIVGQADVIDGVLICLIAGGHVLLEGVPGLGKTTLLRTLSRVLELRYSRIQFTPDLMPGDIVGSMVMDSDDHGHKNLRFQPGPIFANLVLADEINRATPKTQSALLEAMQERTVTSGNSTYSLDIPFLVMATQNPIEMEGTYPLPEAQLDRFLMKVLVSFPSRSDLSKIVDFTTKRDEAEVRQVLDKTGIADLKAICKQVVVAPHVQELAIDLVMATQPGTPTAPEITNRYIRYGSSPRGAQALIECGRVMAVFRHRMHLSVDDLTSVAPAVLRHRMILNFDAHADGENTETILTKLLERVFPRD